MFSKKKKIEVLYNYSLMNGEVNLFTLAYLPDENSYIPIFSDILKFNTLDTLEKILNHFSQNFYYFLKNNMDFEKEKREYLKENPQENVIGYSLFYYIEEVEDGIIVEFPEELETNNIYSLYLGVKLLTDSMRKDIEKYRKNINNEQQ